MILQNIKKHNPNRKFIIIHTENNSWRFWIWEKIIKSLFILIKHQRDFDKLYLYAKDPYAKYQFLITKRQKTVTSF